MSFTKYFLIASAVSLLSHAIGDATGYGWTAGWFFGFIVGSFYPERDVA